ncbi:MAG TPA: hypothetical protein DF383_03160, partial [Deltaproteobacteria bacterium]|nr:hypothetical protein [Deltaproteobacteria bacterium]
ADIKLGDSLRRALGQTPEGLQKSVLDSVVEYFQQRHKTKYDDSQVVLGAGAQPLIQTTIEVLAQRAGNKGLKVAVPQPGYGLYPPTVQAAGAELVPIHTDAKDHFLPRPETLYSQLKDGSKKPTDIPHAVLLTEPNNPGGHYYTSKQIKDLAHAIKAREGYVIYDNVFGLTGFAKPMTAPNSVKILKEILGDRLIVIDSVSKSVAAGGVRAGFAATTDPKLAEEIQKRTLAPDPMAMAATSQYLPQSEALAAEHRQVLRQQAEQLSNFFRTRRIPFIKAQGGFSLYADLNAFFSGYRLTLENGQEVELSRENFHELLMSEAGIKIHADTWAGGPEGHYRFVFSIKRLPEAIQRLDQFFSRLKK